MPSIASIRAARTRLNIPKVIEPRAWLLEQE